MVDGITQSFYGTSTSGTAIHGSTNSMAGVLIDPNFLVGVDVTRGDSSGSSGVNALAGSANLRTIGVDDVVFTGNPFGVRSRFSVGSNGIGRSGMIAAAGKPMPLPIPEALVQWQRSAAARSIPTLITVMELIAKNLATTNS